jgi:hypothetical protein
MTYDSEAALLRAYKGMEPELQYFFRHLLVAVVKGRPRRAARMLRDAHRVAGAPAPTKRELALWCSAARRHRQAA